jgi:hypothetical protein
MLRIEKGILIFAGGMVSLIELALLIQVFPQLLSALIGLGLISVIMVAYGAFILFQGAIYGCGSWTRDGSVR